MDTEKTVIRVEHVSKEFRLFSDKGVYLKEKLLFRNRRRYEVRKVLKDISFEVKKGEAIGLIGENGCGKSTTLKLLSQIMYPDSGTITMKGRVSALIELGAGFHPDMSGRENIYTNAAIFGLSKDEIDNRLQTIIDFSELGAYIDNPVRTYSSGMYMRLAFSVAINVDADILLIDEILAVGDIAFQAKCFNKLREIKRNGTTIIIVSHSLGQIEQICDKSYWIDKGLIRESGDPKTVHAYYLEYMGQKEGNALSDNEDKISETCSETNEKENAGEKLGENERITGDPEETAQKRKRFGSGEVVIDSVTILGDDEIAKETFKSGEKMTVIAAYHTIHKISDAMIGFGIFRVDGVHVAGTNTYIDHLGDVELKEKGTIICEIPHINLVSGEYLFDFAIHSTSSKVYDDWKSVQRIRIYSDTYDIGIVHINHKWEID
ncbi:MAG: ABC transporter ATP-binding protein [Clostridia bacterium]|nr:ABC transporter ATP-binding protein [Clostridia bacterium]